LTIRFVVLFTFLSSLLKVGITLIKVYKTVYGNSLKEKSPIFEGYLLRQNYTLSFKIMSKKNINKNGKKGSAGFLMPQHPPENVTDSEVLMNRRYRFHTVLYPCHFGKYHIVPAQLGVLRSVSLGNLKCMGLFQFANLRRFQVWATPLGPDFNDVVVSGNLRKHDRVLCARSNYLNPARLNLLS